MTRSGPLGNVGDTNIAKEGANVAAPAIFHKVGPDDNVTGCNPMSDAGRWQVVTLDDFLEIGAATLASIREQGYGIRTLPTYNIY